MEFIQQMEWSDGTYYIAFHELSEQEKTMKEMWKAIKSINEINLAVERGLSL